jgi:hypothetical protein
VGAYGVKIARALCGLKFQYIKGWVLKIRGTGGGVISSTGGKIISASDSPDTLLASSMFPVAGGEFCLCCWLGSAIVTVMLMW